MEGHSLGLAAMKVIEVPEPDSAVREPLLVAIMGPTASGKTALAVALAERLGGEIVNCDSVALYREFEIGTAKPSADERHRVLHHLLDVLEPTQASTAGDYSRRARLALKEIKLRRRLPIVAGGTGLYFRALLQGLFPGPPRSEELRARLRVLAEERPAGYLHRVLQRLDRQAAATIHANDTPKLVRAIEVCLSSRQKMTELWQRGRDPLTGFRILRIGLEPERQRLYERINSRAEKMFAAGLVEETRALLGKYGESAWALNSLGYRQAMDCLRGPVERGAAIAAAQQAHRNYAKRQLTWFRREPDVHWLNGFGDDAGVQNQALALVQAHL